MRSLDSKEEATFTARITLPCNNDVTNKTARCADWSQTLPELQSKHASSSGLHQVRAAQAAQRLHCLLLLLQSSSLSSYSLGFQDLARLHLTY